MNEHARFTKKDDYDRDKWERSMFQLQELPPKEPTWQNYFTPVTASNFALFLHYYEPTLNSMADIFAKKYGLKDQLADIKMVCAEELWRLAQAYDPATGEEFLSNIRIKLMAAVQRYAMRNLKGFSTNSATHYYQLRKAAFIYKENHGHISYGEILQMICKTLDITEKTALRLLQEMDALDSFQWYTGLSKKENDMEQDVPVGTDVCEYGNLLPPDQKVFQKETLRILNEAFRELTDKEQDVLGMHLGFCHKCRHPEKPRTYDEIADVYQFGTENGVRRFYQRTLDKLRLLMGERGLFYTVRVKRIRNTAGELIYEYTPMDNGEPGTIDFDVRKGVIQPDYLITKAAEVDCPESQRFGHATARLLLRLARQNDMPTDCVLPLPTGSVFNTLWLQNSAD